MRKAAALVQQLAEALTVAIAAAARGADTLLAPVLPRPEAQLIPVRIRRQDTPSRR